MVTHAMKHMVHQAFQHLLLHSVGSLAAHLTLNHPAALLPISLLFSVSEVLGCEKSMVLQKKAFTMLKVTTGETLKTMSH